MVEQIIKTIISYLVPALIGFLIAQVTGYRKKNNSMKIAIMTLLQSNLTNTYFLYDDEKTIPDYIYKNFLNELKAYEGLDGDDYVHTIAEKMKSWKIIRTDILHDKPQI
jgi:hypothetical protein